MHTTPALGGGLLRGDEARDPLWHDSCDPVILAAWVGLVAHALSVCQVRALPLPPSLAPLPWAGA